MRYPNGSMATPTSQTFEHQCMMMRSKRIVIGIHAYNHVNGKARHPPKGGGERERGKYILHKVDGFHSLWDIIGLLVDVKCGL